jgi:5-methylcytosine-specific restriction protein A
VLDRVKRDLMKFKAVGEETKGKKISKFELKTILKEKRFEEEKERIKNLKPKEKQRFYVTGKFTVETKYNYSTKKGGKQAKVYLDEHVNAKVIEAYTQKEAEAAFTNWGATEYNQDDEDYMGKTKETKQVSNISVKNANDFKAASETDMFMRAANPVEYNFFSQDTTHLKNNGLCVVDVVLGVYAPLIKKLTYNYFIDLCYMVRCECRPIDNKYLNLLDQGIKDDDDEDNNKKGWTIDQGVSPEMLYKICVELDISHYAFDITKNCFLKHVSTNQNYPALLYYAINGHMYYLSDKALCLKLIRSSYKMTTKIKSMIIEDDYEKKNIFDGREIFENIRVSELMNYNKCVIIYSKTNLNEEFDEIISRYNYIPEIKNNKYNFTLIKFNYQDKDIIMVIDPNDRVNLDYKDVKKLCDDNKIIFTNQSFGAFVVQLKDKFFNSKSIRHIFTKEERKAILDETPICVICDKNKGSQIDHIMPLSMGGTNEPENLQVLCKECHFEKTRAEQDEGYVKQSDTESSFNTITKEIFNSKLNNRWAFVEGINSNYNGNTIYSLDINKCRKNAMYFSKYDYPLFTVMDEPVPYKGIKNTGLYFVVTDSYVPMRGNGWYSQPMIEYALEQNLIEEHNIKYALYSSIYIPKDYYNDFIEYVYKTLGDYAKSAILKRQEPNRTKDM